MPFGQSDLQTFYVSSATANLVFHAESANEVWFPSGKLYVAGDGTIVSPLGLGSGSVYTVDSQVSTATPAQLRADDEPLRSLRPRSGRRSSCRTRTPGCRRWPVRSPRTTRNTYDKVQSLIHWIGAHTHYSENIPPLPPGADTVDEFLFGNRVGFCEQISTSLAVMLRSLGIPAREAVGYVPGGFNPITDLYQVHANDAHAWVQVWFPGYGWQDFDPTAVVPVSPAEPRGDRAARRRLGSRPHPSGAGRRGRRGRRSGRRLRALAPGAAGDVGGAGGAAAPSGPGDGPAGPADPPRPWPNTPAGSTGSMGRGRARSTWSRLASAVEASAYGGHDPPPADAARPGRGGQAGPGPARSADAARRARRGRRATRQCRARVARARGSPA